ncbi:response regulator [Verrucomicrobia bacterium]|nr:HDOD domain-containing protein [Verrucomicrobiota bacterium]MDA7866670.1 response regulator [Verrucomicrobiota bacterium]MDB4745716.1 response regulator [Verrucomicrobiota bacterium]
MKPSALIFTDQESILESSRQALQDSWDLQPATSESEARAELENSQYKLILIDKQKISTNESEFLTAADQISPTTPRVQFTKLAPTGELEVHFSHPRVVSDETQAAAQPESFEEQIEHELLRQTLFSKVGLSNILEKIQKTPTRPGVYFKVVEELTNPEGTIDNIAELVKEDPIVTAKILRAVNSTALGLRRRLTDANEAVMMLGGERIRDVILLLEVLSVIDQNRCIGFSPDDVWNHSIQVAQLARKIMAKETRCQSTRDAAFTAGLLHDVGKVLLAVNLPGRYAKTLILAKKNKTSLVEEEYKEFDTSHAEIGTHLLESWEIPIRILEAIMWHHTPEQFSSEKLDPGAAVLIANTLVKGDETPSTSDESKTVSPLEFIHETWGETNLETWKDLLD